MYRELNVNSSYKRIMLIFSALTIICGYAFCLLGELLLPFASAFCAALFLFEDPKRRIYSYIVPVLPIAMAIPFKGVYSLLGIEFVIIAILLVLLYVKGVGKAEASAYLVAVTVVFVILSLAFSAVKATDEFSISAICEYYFHAYEGVKKTFVDYITSFSTQLDDGTHVFLLNPSEAEAYFHSLLSLSVALIVGISFLLTGICIKLFCSCTIRTCKNGLLKSFNFFLPGKITTYFYILVAVISIFASGATVFDTVILNLNYIFMLVFGYLGFKNLLAIISLSARRGLLLSLALAALLLFNSTAIQLLSYFGAFTAIGMNRQTPTGEI